MTTGSASNPDSLQGRVEDVLEKIRPAVQADGGDIELVEITDDHEVRIRFHGECVRCPSSSMTLRDGIEKNVIKQVPQVRSVTAVE